jgi:hypothetical protein
MALDITATVTSPPARLAPTPHPLVKQWAERPLRLCLYFVGWLIALWLALQVGAFLVAVPVSYVARNAYAVLPPAPLAFATGACMQLTMLWAIVRRGRRVSVDGSLAAGLGWRPWRRT